MLDIYDTCWVAVHENEDAYFARMEEFRRIEKIKTTIIKSVFDNIPERPPRVRMVMQDRSGFGGSLNENRRRLEAMLYIMNHEGIAIATDNVGKYTLTYFTSMHNSFNDMSNLLQNIYFEYLTNQGGADFTWESYN